MNSLLHLSFLEPVSFVVHVYFAWFWFDNAAFAAVYDYWDAVTVTFPGTTVHVSRGGVCCEEQMQSVIYSGGFTDNLF